LVLGNILHQALSQAVLSDGRWRASSRRKPGAVRAEKAAQGLGTRSCRDGNIPCPGAELPEQTEGRAGAGCRVSKWRNSPKISRAEALLWAATPGGRLEAAIRTETVGSHGLGGGRLRLLVVSGVPQ